MRKYSTGTKGFFEWLKNKQPHIYKYVSTNFKSPNQLGAVDLTQSTGSSPMLSSITNALQNVLTAGAQVYLTKSQLDAQKKMMDVQLARAQQGLAPLDIDPQQYGIQPTARVGLASDTQKLFLYGGIALAAVVLLPKLLKK